MKNFYLSKLLEKIYLEIYGKNIEHFLINLEIYDTIRCVQKKKKIFLKQVIKKQKNN